MTFKLYYLVDQSGDINGAKTFVGNFWDLYSAQQQAMSQGVLHYSVEQILDAGNDSCIVFIC